MHHQLGIAFQLVKFKKQCQDIKPNRQYHAILTLTFVVFMI